MHGLRNIIVKEMLQLRRDPIRLRMMLLAPVLQLILLGYAANLDVNRIPMVVHDLDNTPASRALVDDFVSSGYFTLEGRIDRPEQVNHALETGEAALALVIPKGFAADLAGGRPAPLQAIADGSDAAFAARSVNYAGMIVREYASGVIVERMMRSGATVRPVMLDSRVRVWFNPELSSRWFFVPGILALVVMVISMIGTAIGVVREKEMGTMEQLIVTPIRPIELIVGKLVPNALVGFVVILLVLSVVRFLFHVPIRGSLGLLLLLSLLFLLTNQGLGLFISTVSRTQQQAMMSAIFFAMLPMLLLSGFVFPIENMPVIFQWFTYLIPVRFYFTIIRGIMLKGVGFEVLWDESLALLVFAVVTMVLSVWRFQKRLG